MQEIDDYFLYFLTGAAGLLGYLFRMFMDYVNAVLNNKKLKRTQHIEFLLSEFYMPIYILLHRENTIWHKIVDAVKNNKDNQDNEFITELDKENLNNHLEIQKIIMSNMAKASPRNDIADQLIKYDEHVTIFKTLRKIGSNDFPIKYNSKYPTELYSLIEERMNELKQDKKILMGLCGNTPKFYIKINNIKNIFFNKSKLNKTNIRQNTNTNEICSPTNAFNLTRTIVDADSSIRRNLNNNDIIDDSDDSNNINIEMTEQSNNSNNI